MEGPISFWGYKEQESNLILPEHDDDDDDYKTAVVLECGRLPGLWLVEITRMYYLSTVKYTHGGKSSALFI